MVVAYFMRETTFHHFICHAKYRLISPEGKKSKFKLICHFNEKEPRKSNGATTKNGSHALITFTLSYGTVEFWTTIHTLMAGTAKWMLSLNQFRWYWISVETNFVMITSNFHYSINSHYVSRVISYAVQCVWVSVCLRGVQYIVWLWLWYQRVTITEVIVGESRLHHKVGESRREWQRETESEKDRIP